MTNRSLDYIVKDQHPLVLAADESVRNACRQMWERRAGSVLVIDQHGLLAGIFTGRDAVRLLAKAKAGGDTRLAQAMTRNPITVSPRGRAVEALKAMSDGGFRHLPVTEGGKVHAKILGVISRGDFKGMEFEAYRWRMVAQAGSARNRALGEIVAKQKPLVIGATATVAEACQAMRKRKAGTVLVVDKAQRLKGIFTGRDAVRVLAKAKDAGTTRLSRAMTADPAALPPERHAVDALRAMNDGGFRHLPIVKHGKVLGVVSRNDFTGAEIDRIEEEEHLKETIW